MSKCFHCGDDIVTLTKFEDHEFCCTGCSSVYQIINNAGLSNFYKENSVGTKYSDTVYFDYLELPEIQKKVISYQDEKRTVVKFILPSIHCASCVWLLERLSKLSPGILFSEVDFLTKRITIHFNHNNLSLKEVGQLLNSIGYEPKLNFKKKNSSFKSLIIKIGVAGFCFGNIMLLSFPEYLGGDPSLEWKQFFSYLNIILSFPIVLYAAIPFYRGVQSALKAKKVSVDILIVIGIISLFGRSLYEIFVLNQGGYIDSLSGLVFFLLIGKWFQAKVFSELSFEKENSNYLPLAILKKGEDGFSIAELNKINNSDVIRVRNGEIVPFNSKVVSLKGKIDNSFITGEELPIPIKEGDKVFCGAQVLGEYLDLEVENIESEQLSDLWRSRSSSDEVDNELINSKVITVFTITILLIAISSFIFWSFESLERAFLASTSVLIIACPCALALSAPTVFGLILRKMAKHGLYLKSPTIIKKLSEIRNIVFDKTGTITNKKIKVEWHGDVLNETDQLVVNQMIKNSTHSLASELVRTGLPSIELNEYKEYPGEGMVAKVGGSEYKIGVSSFLGIENDGGGLRIYVEKEKQIVGKFVVKLSTRKGMEEMMTSLKGDFNSYLLSGDPGLVKSDYKHLFANPENIVKDASPETKRKKIVSLNNSVPTLMIGDGINDSLAFDSAHVGVSVIEKVGSFFPSCDGLLEGGKLKNLNSFISLSRYANQVLIFCYVFSFTYNIIGLYYAVTLSLTPLFSAILMPLSSVSVVVIANVALRLKFFKEIPE